MPPSACVYLLESRAHRRGLRTKREHWQAEGVFSSRAEAEEFARRHRPGLFHGWRVTAIPAVGELAKLLAVELRAGCLPDVGL